VLRWCISINAAPLALFREPGGILLKYRRVALIVPESLAQEAEVF
jgi:hypothetical protein